MGTNDRQRQIFELVQRKQSVTVGYLSRKLYVSEMTVRRDLKAMAQNGLIKRIHGGAMAHNDYLEYPLAMRMHINEKEKRELAARVTAYIRDGQTIFLNNSSTCAYIIPVLRDYRDITVLTNSVPFVQMLSKYRIPCILTGGEYREGECCLVGRDAENFLRGINTDLAFLSCDGVAEDGAVTVRDGATAEIVKIAYKNAARRIILAHHSKLGAKYTYNICHRDEADDVIVF